MSKIKYYRDQKFRILPGVYKPAEDTTLLADNLKISVGEKVLELGTGCGLISIIAAKAGAKIIATDVNPKAIECAKKNAENHGVLEKIDFKEGDLFEPVRGEEFDLIIFNPPYLPVSSSESLNIGLARAWDGGEDGRKVIDNFLDRVSDYLKEEGRLIFVQSSLSGVQETLNILEKKGFSSSIESEKKLSFEKLCLIKAF
ncbi:hypothetical protein AKJ49_01780 [candidate division MSBL1 archaeon SCGC-AAA382A03]|uniref:Methyltransferase small domain-containing protein n=1 Tax=candidate division MSBL1 archaeon SCGC-AAA382A03 TaxID=1698278 RepID=A0A133VE47_9EURY|nr:hypothetical protein AKJ49_01780 [candidate division MSBL1 archaeon SCGC-AAA382A03]